MDEEDTRGYKEPCPQCSEVNWGISDEGKFYCKSCHTVIEKTREVDEEDLFLQGAKVQSLSRGLRKEKREEKGWEWYVCEGFQFVVFKQAEALQALGVNPRIKDEVICNFWRRYLQKTRQAYCKKPVPISLSLSEGSQSSADFSDLSSEPEVFSNLFTSDSEGGSISNTGSILPSSAHATSASEAEGFVSVRSGSIDGASYKKKRKRWERKMSMPMTLAFCYLSLLWLRESITLSDLLRLVFNHHIPYFNPEQYFPEQTKIYGLDISIFKVQSFPEYRNILELTHELGVYLDLPRFPPMTDTCFYHPNVLCMKYLMEVNLPDELHNWTYRVAKKTGLDDVTALTYDPLRKQTRLIPYDIQAVAIIVIVLKILFILNDDWEWKTSKIAQERNKNAETTVFDFKKWYETIRPCMEEAQQRLKEEQARFSWKADRVLHYSRKSRSKMVKRKRMAGNLKRQFSKLAGAAPDAGNHGPSSFLFNWEEQNTSKIYFHGHSLEGITQFGDRLLSGKKTHYWFSCLKKCTSKYCKHWKLYDSSKFSGSYDFVLSLFSLVLGVELCTIHHEVCLIEEKLFENFLKKNINTREQRS
ncbi:TATA box-binding protein-associated factor RNA polymerase I subunit B isoform X2 [Hyperolius riggenbachi]|uniref:TATA box-binding protein-associated factor RNA polymerase I subunit B isoform X2 n=1 Tax=Hyperolius riggenbachi TaxID=752182 RepID=UPI0035A2ECC6